MNPRFDSIPLKARLLGATVLWLTLVLQTALSQAAPAAQGAAAGDAPAPQAVFVMPHGPPEGRDPFFPRSMRPYAYVAQPTQAVVVVTADLRLSGISGSAEHRLAIVNNRTFEVGEEGEVTSGSEKVRIRLLEIRADAVVIQFVSGGTRRELKLRRGV